MKQLLLMLALAAAACSAGADLLWDQLVDVDNLPGFASQDFETLYDANDCWAADDFTVSGAGWVIESCDWTAYFSFGVADVYQVNFYIWPDDGTGHADTSSPSFVQSGFMNQTLFYGINHYDFDPADQPVLDPGHYFLGVQVEMDYLSWGQAYWYATSVTPQGSYFAIINPGGGLGYGTDWFNPVAPDVYDASFRLSGYMLPSPIEVEIDVKPGSYPNTINLGSNGVVPVAILSSVEFDATQGDPDTIELAGSGVAVRGKGNKYMAHAQDVNSDGLMDLVVQVETENLDPGELQDGYAILTGLTYDLEAFEGMDEITIVPPE